MRQLIALPKYKAYKDSGVEWLDVIPTTWKTLPAKYFNLIKKHPNKQCKYKNILSLTLRGVVNNDLDNPEGLVPKDYSTYQIFEKNDLVFKLIDLENFKTSRVGIVHEKGIMSPAYIKMVIGDEFIPKYSYYYYFNLYLNTIYNYLGAGVRLTIGPSDLIRIPIISPPKKEQTTIANFLDKKTAQINKAIAIKEKQIQLLKEYQQTIIQKAITQGLDPNVPMKDSGIEWIGKVPKYYEVLPMKRVAKLSPSTNAHNQNPENKVCFLPMEKVSTDGEIICDIKVQAKDVNQGFTVFNKNDVIVAKITPCFENGKSAFLANLETDHGYGSTEFHVLRPSKEILGKFLYYIVHSHAFLKAGETMMTGSAGQKRVPSSFISNFTVILPSIDNQKNIIKFIEKESAKIKSTIKIQNQQIQKLKEYKTTLINSAVTGKIKLS